MTQPALDPGPGTSPPADPPGTTGAPSLVDLANTLEQAAADYASSKSQADASAAQAQADKANEANKHTALQTAIQAIVSAAQKEDPDPSSSSSS